MLPEPIAVTICVTKVFEELRIPYLIGGSLASAIYGMVRSTQDSDIVAQVGHEHLESFIHALENEFYLDNEMIIDAIEKHSSFNIFHQQSMFKVDIFIPQMRSFMSEQFKCARR